jgi:hypothetical protein
MSEVFNAEYIDNENSNLNTIFDIFDITPENIRNKLLKSTSVEIEGKDVNKQTTDCKPASLLKTKQLLIQHIDKFPNKIYISTGEETKISRQTLRIDAVLSKSDNLDIENFVNFAFGTLFAAMLLGNGLKIFKYTLSIELSSKESRLTIYTYLNKSDIKGETKNNLERLLKTIAVNVKKDYHAEVLPLNSSEKTDYRASRDGLPKFGRHDEALNTLLINAINFLFKLELDDV